MAKSRGDGGVVETTEDDTLRLPLAHERLVVSKREVEEVAARIALRTHTIDTTITEPLRRERVEIERVPVDRIVADAPEIRSEEGVMIIPVVEEILVRQFRIVEELRITRHIDTETCSETVSLRRQEAVIDDALDARSIGPDGQAEGST